MDGFGYGQCAVCGGVLDKPHAGFSVCLIGGVLTDIVVFHDNSYGKPLKKMKKSGTGVEYISCGNARGVLNQCKGAGARSGCDSGEWFVAVGNIAEVFDALEAGFPRWSDKAKEICDKHRQQLKFIALKSKYSEVEHPAYTHVGEIPRRRIIEALGGFSSRYQFIEVKQSSKSYLFGGRRLVEISPLVKQLLMKHGSSFARLLVSVLLVVQGKRWINVCRELSTLCDGKNYHDIIAMTRKWHDWQSAGGCNQLSSHGAIKLLQAIFIPVPVQRFRV